MEFIFVGEATGDVALECVGQSRIVPILGLLENETLVPLHRFTFKCFIDTVVGKRRDDLRQQLIAFRCAAAATACCAEEERAASCAALEERSNTPRQDASETFSNSPDAVTLAAQSLPVAVRPSVQSDELCVEAGPSEASSEDEAAANAAVSSSVRPQFAMKNSFFDFG